MTTPTAEERKEWRKLCDAATPAPWKLDREEMYLLGPDGEMVAMIRGHGARLPQEVNGGLLEAAREAMPRLLDALDEAEAAFERVSGPFVERMITNTTLRIAKEELNKAENERDRAVELLRQCPCMPSARAFLEEMDGRKQG